MMTHAKNSRSLSLATSFSFPRTFATILRSIRNRARIRRIKVQPVLQGGHDLCKLLFTIDHVSTTGKTCVQSVLELLTVG